MLGNNAINIIVEETVAGLKDVFKEKLSSVILYGSFARNDFDNESDIDIMALVDLENKDISKYLKEINKHIEPLEMKYDIVISPIIQNIKQYEQYKVSLPFFRNIEKEGVVFNV